MSCGCAGKGGTSSKLWNRTHRRSGGQISGGTRAFAGQNTGLPNYSRHLNVKNDREKERDRESKREQVQIDDPCLSVLFSSCYLTNSQPTTEVLWKSDPIGQRSTAAAAAAKPPSDPRPKTGSTRNHLDSRESPAGISHACNLLSSGPIMPIAPTRSDGSMSSDIIKIEVMKNMVEHGGLRAEIES